MGLNFEQREWAIEDRPAVTVQATITRAADASGPHVCRSITASIAAVGTASGVEVVVLRDGATGTGTVLWSKVLSATVNGTASADLTGLNIVGSKNTAMTLEFIAGGAAATFESVAMSGVTDSGASV